MEPINLWNVYRIFDMATEIDVKEILKQRGDRYGSYTRVSSVAQYLKNVCRESDNWTNHKFSLVQQESLDMICNKLSRILNGDPKYRDSWADIAGYAQLVVNDLDEEPKL
jgi:hypothetical protein